MVRILGLKTRNSRKGVPRTEKCQAGAVYMSYDLFTVRYARLTGYPKSGIKCYMLTDAIKIRQLVFNHKVLNVTKCGLRAKNENEVEKNRNDIY